MLSLETLIKRDTCTSGNTSNESHAWQSFNLLSCVAWMDISSIDFTSSAIFSVEVLATIVDLVIIGSVVVGGVVGANNVANVEGIVVFTVGASVVEVVAMSLFLD